MNDKGFSSDLIDICLTGPRKAPKNLIWIKGVVAEIRVALLTNARLVGNVVLLQHAWKLV
jgi:hypothetical protein